MIIIDEIYIDFYFYIMFNNLITNIGITFIVNFIKKKK